MSDHDLQQRLGLSKHFFTKNENKWNTVTLTSETNTISVMWILKPRRERVDNLAKWGLHYSERSKKPVLHFSEERLSDLIKKKKKQFWGDYRGSSTVYKTVNWINQTQRKKIIARGPQRMRLLSQRKKQTSKKPAWFSGHGWFSVSCEGSFPGFS